MGMTHRGLLDRIAACTQCAAHLPLPPKPILQWHPQARLLIAGQAPGLHAHRSGIPFDDASGARLRAWLGLDRSTFYDATRVAIVPMGFCYPGKTASGDAPPRPECAAAWRAPLLDGLKHLRLTVVIGRYALDHHWREPTATVTDAVLDWRRHWPLVVPLPHPSPRNNGWLAKNPWFEANLLPALRDRVREALLDEE
jgi:uracil-DNA glycosylase